MTNRLALLAHWSVRQKNETFQFSLVQLRRSVGAFTVRLPLPVPVSLVIIGSGDRSNGRAAYGCYKHKSRCRLRELRVEGGVNDILSVDILSHIFFVNHARLCRCGLPSPMTFLHFISYRLCDFRILNVGNRNIIDLISSFCFQLFCLPFKFYCIAKQPRRSYW